MTASLSKPAVLQTKTGPAVFLRVSILGARKTPESCGCQAKVIRFFRIRTFQCRYIPLRGIYRLIILKLMLSATVVLVEHSLHRMLMCVCMTDGGGLCGLCSVGGARGKA